MQQIPSYLVPFSFLDTRNGSIVLAEGVSVTVGTSEIVETAKPDGRRAHTGKAADCYEDIPYRPSLTTAIGVYQQIVAGVRHPKTKRPDQTLILRLYNSNPQGWSDIMAKARSAGLIELRDSSVAAALRIAQDLDERTVDAFFEDLAKDAPEHPVVAAARQAILSLSDQTVLRIEIMVRAFREFAELPWRATLTEMATR